MAQLISDQLPDVFGNPQAPRKTMDQLMKSDPKKAEEQLEKSKEFAIKMMLAEARNMDPFSEESGGRQAQQMLETANLITQLDCATVQVQKLGEMAEAIKNPGYNALELQGKEVFYNDNKRYFDGNNPVSFCYSVDMPDAGGTGLANITIKITDKDGRLILDSKANAGNGEHSFMWDGNDKNGKKVSAGEYFITVSATRKQLIGGQELDSVVKASTAGSARVDSVEVENGIVTRLALANGKVIAKDQVIKIRDVVVPETMVQLSPDLFGATAEFDLSKAEIQGGNLEVYFNNQVENPGSATIEVYDLNGKFIKNFTSDAITAKGFGKVNLEKTGLPDGYYKLKVTVQDTDRGSSNVVLNGKINGIIVGLDYQESAVLTLDEHWLKPYHIVALTANYTKEIDQRAAQYQGGKVEFNNSEIIFEASGFAPEVISAAPKDADAVISHELLRIYNKQGDFVAELRANYRAYDYLDDGSKAALPTPVQLRHSGDHNREYDKTLRIQDNLDIEEGIRTGIYKVKSEFSEIYKQGYRKLSFPKWDGSFGEFAPSAIQGTKATSGEVFKIEHMTAYTKKDGTSVLGGAVVDKATDIVVSVDKEHNELFLNLQSGKRIREGQILAFAK